MNQKVEMITKTNLLQQIHVQINKQQIPSFLFNYINNWLLVLFGSFKQCYELKHM